MFRFDETHKDVAEFVLTEILKEGLITITKLVKLFNELPESDLTLKDLESVVTQLCQGEFIRVMQDVRQYNFEDKLERPELKDDDEEGTVTLVKSIFEGVASQQCTSTEGPALKKRKTSTEGDGIYWGFNFERCHQLMRDEEIVSGFERKYGVSDSIGTVVKSILRLASKRTNFLSPTTTSVYRTDISQFCQDQQQPMTDDDLTQALEVLTDSSDGLVLVGEKNVGGGSYSLSVLRCLEKLTSETIASIVEHKFGSRASRIFRILAANRMFPQKMVEEQAMMAPKDCKEIMFTLVKSGFIRTNYYSKVTDYAPPKTHFIFSVDWDQVTRMVMNTCIKTVLNTSRRRAFEYQQNKALIEKKSYVEQQISQLRLQEGTEQQIADLEGYFTENDLKVIESSENACRQLHVGELHADQTLFLLETWLCMRRDNDKTK